MEIDYGHVKLFVQLPMCIKVCVVRFYLFILIVLSVVFLASFQLFFGKSVAVFYFSDFLVPTVPQKSPDNHAWRN